ncbi:MAG: hypothetical protein ACTS6J_14180 [Burkholderiales bacterium]
MHRAFVGNLEQLGALFLGVVWSPCVRPTLGATITLASQGQQLGQLMLVMAPLIAAGSGQEVSGGHCSMATGEAGK